MKYVHTPPLLAILFSKQETPPKFECNSKRPPPQWALRSSRWHLTSKFIFWLINYLFIWLMPELHGRCRTVCPNNRKLKSNLFSPLNFLNRTNGSKIRAFLSVTSEPSVGGVNPKWDIVSFFPVFFSDASPKIMSASDKKSTFSLTDWEIRIH